MTVATVTIQIMGRTFNIQCPESKVNELEESAEFIDKKISDLALDSKVVHRENVLVIMALNIARELLDHKSHLAKDKNYLSLISEKLRELKTTITEELAS